MPRQIVCKLFCHKINLFQICLPICEIIYVYRGLEIQYMNVNVYILSYFDQMNAIVVNRLDDQHQLMGWFESKF